jgi:hypothetical protein
VSIAFLDLRRGITSKLLWTGESWDALKKRTLGFLSVLAWLGIYIFVLLKYVSYPGATCIFLFVFMILFHIKERRSITLRDGAVLFFTAFLMSWLLTFVFRDVARIPLP